MKRIIDPVRLRMPDDVNAALEARANSLFGDVNTARGKFSPQNGSTRTFVLIEAARCADIAVMFEGFGAPYFCLYTGEAAEDYALEAPYIAEVVEGSAFADWLMTSAWGKGFAVFVRSQLSLVALRKHFRKFTRLHDAEADQWYHFRFYTPEFVRGSLPMMPPRELSEFTQDIDAILTESADARSMYVI